MLKSLFGWRKMIAALVSEILILLPSYLSLGKDGGISGAEWVECVKWAALIVLGLLGANGLTHVAQAFGKNGNQ